MVHLPLGAGEDGIVVRQDGAARPFVVEDVAVDPPDPGHEAVGRRVGDEVLDAAARPLGGEDQPAVLLEAAGVAQVLDVLPRRPPPTGVPALGGGGPSRIERGGHPGPQLGQLGAHAAPDVRDGRGGARPRLPSDSVICTITSPVCTASPGATRTVSMTPGVAASTTCSIFMDSSTTRTVPAATRSPAATVTRRTVPANGTVSPATAGEGPRSRRGCPRCCGRRPRGPVAGTPRPRCRWDSRS